MLSFVCDRPDDLPVKRRRQDDEELKGLEQFAREVKNDKLVKPWAVGIDPEKIAVCWSLVDEMKKGAMRAGPKENGLNWNGKAVQSVRACGAIP